MDPIYPLDNILSLYQDKQKVILTYLPNQTSLKLHNFNYTTHIDQLYLNDHISFVSKTTGILEYSGKITRIKNKPDIIHIFYKNHTVKLNPHNYYLFIKQKYTKQNKRDFMKALLNSLN